MSLKRPKSIVLLIIVFAWSFFKGAELLVRGSSTADRNLFDQVGLGWLSTGAMALIAVLDLAAIRYLIKPAPAGLLICLASISFSALQTSIGFAIARLHPEAARRAIVVSRESRGLSVREDALQAVMDPTMSLPVGWQPCRIRLVGVSGDQESRVFCSPGTRDADPFE